jgi:hypothetical protein
MTMKDEMIELSGAALDAVAGGVGADDLHPDKPEHENQKPDKK